MADTGWINVDAVKTNNNVTNPTNALASDDAYATYDDVNDYLDLEFPDLGVPAGATINGIEVSIEGYYTGVGVNHNVGVRLWNNSSSSLTASSGTYASDLDTTDASYTLPTSGGSTDLWGKTWVANDFANGVFYIRVALRSFSVTSVEIDNAQVKVYYTVPLISTISDNFDDNSIDTGLWNEIEGGSSTVTETNQRLEIALPSSATSSDYNALYSLADYDLTAGEAFVEIIQMISASTAANMTLVLYLDSTHYFRIVVESGTIYFQYRNGGSNVTLSSTAFVLATHKWWRIREASGTTYFDTSTDGSSWTNRDSIANPFAVTALQVQLEVYCYQNETDPGTGIFDNFNTPPASASLSPSISASISPSLSPSLSPSVSPSLSPSISPSVVVSASISPSVSPSVSPSASISPSVSPSFSASISPSLSASISPSISPSFSASISPSVSPSSSISPSLSSSLSPSVSPSVSPSASISPSVSPSPSPSAERYYLAGYDLPRPSSLSRGFIYTRTDFMSIKGTLSRDYSAGKEVFVLKWDVLSKAEFDTILSIVEMNTPVDFSVNETNLTITTTSVIPKLGRATYETPGSSYILSAELELTEVS